MSTAIARVSDAEPPGQPPALESYVKLSTKCLQAVGPCINDMEKGFAGLAPIVTAVDKPEVTEIFQEMHKGSMHLVNDV